MSYFVQRYVFDWSQDKVTAPEVLLPPGPGHWLIESAQFHAGYFVVVWQTGGASSEAFAKTMTGEPTSAADEIRALADKLDSMPPKLRGTVLAFLRERYDSGGYKRT